jgi:magnesium transporter
MDERETSTGTAESQTAAPAFMLYDNEGTVSPRALLAITSAIADRDTIALNHVVADLHESELGDLLEALRPEQRKNFVHLLGCSDHLTIGIHNV